MPHIPNYFILLVVCIHQNVCLYCAPVFHILPQTLLGFVYIQCFDRIDHYSIIHPTTVNIDIKFVLRVATDINFLIIQNKTKSMNKEFPF